jgi:DHA2 family multidrug resistance protein
MSMIFVTLATTTMWTLRNEQMGTAASIFNLMRNIGGSLGIAGMTTFLARGAQAHQAILVSHLTPYDPAYQRWLQTAQAGLASKVGEQAARPKALGLLYGVLLQQAQLLSFMDIFRVLAILCLLGVPLAFLFQRAGARTGPPLRTDHQAARNRQAARPL